MDTREHMYQKSIIGVFPNIAAAENAVESLRSAGIADSHIRMVDAQDYAGPARSDSDAGHRRGFLKRLFGFDMDRQDEQTRGYEGRLQEHEQYFGGLAHGDEELVIVDETLEADLVADILRRNGGRLEAEAAERLSASAEELRRIVLREEQVTPVLQEFEAGEVRVRKEVVTETKTFDVPVSHEELVIERRTLAPDEIVGSTGGLGDDRQLGDDDEIRISLKQEEVTIDKRTVPREEVVIGKRRVEETEHLSAEVSKEEARVERTGALNARSRKKSSVENDRSMPPPLT